MGAWTNDGLFWINPSGKVFLVNTVDNKRKMSHEEYAERKWGLSLEEVLEKKYIRVQSIPNQYLYVDHKQNKVRPAQQQPLAEFFQKPYPRIVIERPPNNIEQFKEGQQAAALQFAIDGFIPQTTTRQDTEFNSAQTQHPVGKYYHPGDFANQHASYLNRPGVNPIGDSYDFGSFSSWLRLRESSG